MDDGNPLSGLGSLPEDVLDEVVREGERRLDAQFSAANASDQRAMSWCGLLITITIAGLGAAATFASLGKGLLTIAAVTFSLLVLVATYFGLAGARPQGFHFPGNLPENWLPDRWQGHPGCSHCLTQARLEQAVCLNNAIHRNVRWAEASGRALHRSMNLVIFSVFAGALAVGAALVFE